MDVSKRWEEKTVYEQLRKTAKKFPNRPAVSFQLKSGFKDKATTLNWDNLLKVINRQTIKFKEISKYPEVKRDFSLLINEDVTFENIFKLAKQTENNFLKDVNLYFICIK